MLLTIGDICVFPPFFSEYLSWSPQSRHGDDDVLLLVLTLTTDN